ncbi:hypothetical protein BD779DRAFT_1475648 [Infundibulicybe gibba]|nr:hypothetical protein BD779DRAFT_1475648 [Infundibulicybe gibba]
MLFDSLVKSNPKHAPGWIAAACLEEHAGRMVKARQIIKAGCDQCQKSEDVWLEAARLHNNEDAKVILANAVQHVGQSVKVWMAAADLEHDVKAKKRVLRKALEHIPNSVQLWKETVNLESSATDARILLSRAVEVIPLHEIWIAAGRLLEQEASANPDKSEEQRNKELEFVDKMIEAGVRELRKHQVLLTRDQWLKEAERCQAEGSPRTCEAIVKATRVSADQPSPTVAMEVEEEDRLDTWVGDAESAESRGMMGTARAVLAYALKVYPDRKSLWRRAAELEKTHGTRQSLDAILTRAVHHCPQAEVLWLMSAKEKWLAGDVPAAREVLEHLVGRVKLEAENGELGVARELLVRARTVADTERIWMKSAVFERQQGQLSTALETLAAALTKFPKFAKLYMIQGQIYQSQKNHAAARASFAAGLKTCPKEATLWILASRLEEADSKSIKARALLEKARLVNPANDSLWAEAVGVEERSGVPNIWILWSMSIWAESRPTRKARSVDALKKSADNPVIICTVARLFWAERKIEKARQWFGRAVVTDPDLGDSWAWWLKFERQHGTEVGNTMFHSHSSNIPMTGAPRGRPEQIAKDIGNTGRTIRELLEMVADALQ